MKDALAHLICFLARERASHYRSNYRNQSLLVNTTRVTVTRMLQQFE